MLSFLDPQKGNFALQIAEQKLSPSSSPHPTLRASAKSIRKKDTFTMGILGGCHSMNAHVPLLADRQCSRDVEISSRFFYSSGRDVAISLSVVSWFLIFRGANCPNVTTLHPLNQHFHLSLRTRVIATRYSGREVLVTRVRDSFKRIRGCIDRSFLNDFPSLLEVLTRNATPTPDLRITVSLTPLITTCLEIKRLRRSTWSASSCRF